MPAGIMFLERFFGLRRSESAKDVIYGLDRVNFKYLLCCVLLNFINVYILNQVYCMMCSGQLCYFKV